MSYLVEPHAHDSVTKIVHNNRRKFEPCEVLVDEANENVNAELVDNEDVYD